MSNTYPFKSIEKKWQKNWREQQTYQATKNTKKNKAYILEMLPYPSGRLHMGHVRNYAIGDAIARFAMAQGYNVLHPMGWDSFGLPAENAAIAQNSHPQKWTLSNIDDMRSQLKSLGLSYDWSREISTCMPDYYRHEQHIFLDMVEKGLAYRNESWVNWDPIDQSVLANEQVINGCGWRSGAPVERRMLTQWMIRITDYAEELLSDLKKLEGKWPEKVIRMQENWIGKSQGALVDFKVEGHPDVLTVYTTRPDVLFGASYVAIAADHPLSLEIAQQNDEIKAFIDECRKVPTTEEAMSTLEKKGCATGLYAEHPFDSSIKLPIWVTNYVLITYGTGAVYGCPAHDERDYAFATTYNLPIPCVISGEAPLPILGDAGTLINSSFLNGLSVTEAKNASIKRLTDLGTGKPHSTYRLRDWLVSRQRYWGCPIPIIYCNTCGTVPVPKNDLPVKLPDDVDFSKSGNPLDHHPTWKHVNCPKCQQKAVRETDTLDTFVDSCWYFLRYCSPQNNDFPFDKSEADYWMPVDWYIGGIEHAILHLLYARFFTKVLRDLGYITIDEPFKQLLTQGMVCHQTYQDATGKWYYPFEVEKTKDGYRTIDEGAPITVGRTEKMSKSKMNLVDPLKIIDSYGADVARLFILSDSPPEKDFEWNDEGIDGAWRFINRTWRLGQEILAKRQCDDLPQKSKSEHVTDIHKIASDITLSYQQNSFNKTIALVRSLTALVEEEINNLNHDDLTQCLTFILQALAPIAPHMCQEIWSTYNEGEICFAPWYEVDQKRLDLQKITIAVQVMGKMRGTVNVSKGADEDLVKELATAIPYVATSLQEKQPRKVIFVKDRIINFIF